MNITEKKAVDYAISKKWNKELLRLFICSDLTLDEFNQLEGNDSEEKIMFLRKKYKQ